MAERDLDSSWFRIKRADFGSDLSFLRILVFTQILSDHSVLSLLQLA